LVEFQGFGFGDLEHTNPIIRALNFFCNFSYWMKMKDKKSIFALSRRGRKVVQKIDRYFSYDCFRQTTAFNIIKKYFKPKENEVFDVLIIGDGYGFLSALIKDCYPQARITLIDIGEVLIFQSVNLGRIYPNCTHSFINQNKDADFLYIPADKIPADLERAFWLIVNISSMQEMNSQTIEFYFDFIRRHIGEENIFYSCNRISKTLPAGEVIEFLKYPWKKEDKILLHETCPFYKYFFSYRWPFFHSFDGLFYHRIAQMHSEGSFK